MHKLDFAKYREILTACGWQTGTKTLAPAIADWLLYTESLTLKLQQHYPNLAVEIIQQGWQNGREPSWIREVVLKCDGQPLLFAQTVVPKATIDNVAPNIPTLGETPIGLWLFAQSPERQSLEWRYDDTEHCYARRSTLLLQQYPIEIRELFLRNFDFK